jgi:diguanylate cyclase (GGDEF)-like protein/PAS domain S-box-containing protein
MSRSARFSTTRPRNATTTQRDGASEFEQSSTDGNEPSALSEQADKLLAVFGLASIYYWELDADFRVSHIWCGNEHESEKAAALLLGKARWDAGGIPVGTTWRRHREALEAHEPFDDLIVEWTEASGSKRYLRSTGRLRFGSHGEFVGYLGITQDVTAELQRRKLRDLEFEMAEVLSAGCVASQLEPVLQCICETLGWRRGDYWEHDRDRSMLNLQASTESGVEDDQRPLEVSIADWIAGRARDETGPVPADEILNAEWSLPMGEAGTFVVPLREGDELMGLLEFVAEPMDYPRDELSIVFGRLADRLERAREHERALESIRERESLFATTVDLAAIGICHVMDSGRIIHANRRLCEILDYTREELLARSVDDISHPEDRDVARPHIERLISGEVDTFQIEKRYVRKDGNVIWVRINTVGNRNRRGEVQHHISVVEDISDKKAAEARIEHLATHDALTGLPNRSLFQELLSKSILSRARAGRGHCAVIFIDLDRFKPVNDSLGHQAGDELLKAIGRRIKDAVRATDCVARFGGDEFVVLLDGFERESDAETIARKVLSELQKPIRVARHTCRVTGSIGYAVCPEDGDDGHLLLRYADMAMYAAKEAGRNAIQRYSADLTSMSVKQINLGTHLKNGLERGEFRLRYQPRVNARDGRIVAAEALLRWWNSELGTIPPVQFVPVAEETGQIVPIGRWTLKQACMHCASWRHAGLEPAGVSVNLSQAQLMHANLLVDVGQALEHSGLDPSLLELEIPEAAVVLDIERSIAVARRLKSLGVRIAIDDFGIDSASVDDFSRFPVDTLKIDRSLTRDPNVSSEVRSKLAALVATGKRFGASVVAEGIEHESQRRLMMELGCDELQGFLFGSPCHPRELERMLAEQSR